MGRWSEARSAIHEATTEEARENAIDALWKLAYAEGVREAWEAAMRPFDRTVVEMAPCPERTLLDTYRSWIAENLYHVLKDVEGGE